MYVLSLTALEKGIVSPSTQPPLKTPPLVNCHVTADNHSEKATNHCLAYFPH